MAEMLDAHLPTTSTKLLEAATHFDQDAPRTVMIRASGATLYRVEPSQASVPLLLAVCVDGQYQTVAQRRLEHGYSFRERLDPNYATVPLSLLRIDGMPAMLMTDPGGRPLHERLEKPMPLEPLLRIAVATARSIGHMHARSIVHKDLRPCNILVDSRDQVFLTGFGGASLLSREHAQPGILHEISAGLPYMSPEQSGRINRAVDARSDLYSFGITLYEMATGSLPFQATDAMEWVHCHVAREPIAPAVLAPEVPEVLSSIIMRLLRKSADERYQTAAGIEADLARCLKELTPRGRILPFPLGGSDMPDRLMRAERLFGRDAEVKQLLNSYQRIATTGRPELVMISGYSGIGKSSIVGELRKLLVAEHGHFAAGKFEQHKRDIPYSTIAQAIRSLVAQLLTLDHDALSGWRQTLNKKLSPNGQIVINLVAELEHVIGKQPPIIEASSSEGNVRFHRTIQRFLSAFSLSGSPLVLFIDDLQWVDPATLGLLCTLTARAEPGGLMVVGAYRSNEIDDAHPLSVTLKTLRAAGAPVLELQLEAMSSSDLEDMVATTLRDDTGRSVDLASLIWTKTQGNPFFSHQFLEALAEQRLLWLDRAAMRWDWDIEGIRARNYSDNVADLMAEKLRRFPQSALHQLMNLSCIGASATVSTLSRISNVSAGELHEQMRPAEQNGLVSRTAGGYRFLHDKIQEAAYALLPPQDRSKAHLGIGRRLLEGASPHEIDPLVFELTNQFDRGAELLVDDEERICVAALFLRAGRRAMAETAHAAALSYFIRGGALLGDRGWDEHAALAFDLSYARAEAEFLVGDGKLADLRLIELAPRASTLLQRVSVASLHITVCLGLDDSTRAIGQCLGFMQDVGAPLPQRPTLEQVSQEYELLIEQTASRTIESLLDLPEMVDAQKRAMLEVLAAVLPSAFFSDENLVCLVLCRMANLSITYGNADASPLAYAYLGMMVGPYFGNYEAAFKFGKLGYDVVEKAHYTRYQARVYMCFAYHVTPWAKDIRSGLALLRRAFLVSRDAGDVTYAGFSSCTLITSLLAAGEPLERVADEAGDRLKFVTAARFGLVVDIMTSQLQLVRCLKGEVDAFGYLNGDDFSEAAFEGHLASNRNLDIAACWYWIRKAQARFMAGYVVEARAACSKASTLLWTSKGHLELAEYHFYAGLICAASCDGATDAERAQNQNALAQHREQIDRWARHCPDTFLPASELLAAEASRIQGDDMAAMRHYDAAAVASKASAFLHIEGISLELSARFHTAHGHHVVAIALLRAARMAYTRWGAAGKVRQLEKQHATLGGESTIALSDGGSSRLSDFDVQTLMRLSQAVSAEKGLDKLMRTLMTVALEHAGADRGLLILPNRDNLRIEAQAEVTDRMVNVAVASSTVTALKLPLSLLHYAIRTRTVVLVEDARAPGQFENDPYLSLAEVRSVLCLPLVKQGDLIGMLYLENRLSAGVFTPNRVALLTLLTSMAATSLANASLEEKESLLQEVHHRVKNNLQLISSLLNLQASKVEDPAVAELFAESRNRVRSMALVHENLYRAGNFARIPMAAHISNLCAQLSRAYGMDERRVTLRTSLEDVQLGLNRAVSCGLIVNELVSNALKHAFPAERSGEILVTLRSTPNGRYAFTISDDGIGLPQNMDIAEPGTLGLQLIDDLAHQLHGELSISRHPGTTFMITFDADIRRAEEP